MSTSIAWPNLMVKLLQDRRVKALEVWVRTNRDDDSSYTNLNPPNENGEPLLLLPGQTMIIEITEDGILSVHRRPRIYLQF
jgi:hypothetical protein